MRKIGLSYIVSMKRGDKWLIEALADEGWTKKCIVDEYGDSYSPIEFLQAVETPIEYQSCCEFS
jgi:hypothetical protein